MSRRINWGQDGTMMYVTWNDGVTLSTVSSTDIAKIDDSIGYEPDAVIANGTNKNPWFYFNFGSEVTIDKIGFGVNYDENILLEVSSDTTSGMDGTWTPTMSYTATTGSWSGIDYVIPTTPTAGTWARIKTQEWTPPSWYYIFKIHLFGGYTTPNFRLFDGTGTSEITQDSPFQFPNALSNVLYDQDQTFTIKNVDSEIHSYSIEVEAGTYAADTFITTYFTATPSTVTDLGVGATSSAITINGTIPAINNPKDGKHYIKVKVTETA